MSILERILPAFAVLLLLPFSARPQEDPPQDFSAAVEQVTDRDDFRHARFGIAVYSLDEQRYLYRRNATEYFVPASTVKLVTEGTALDVLGSDHRFRTRVYRTGPIDDDGVLRGDLVLVAAGDPNLSHRVRGDSLAFTDHEYPGMRDARRPTGDPLQVIRDLAVQVSNAGVRRIAGRVRVDAGLFDRGGERYGGGTVSPLVVNDNVIEVWVEPGDTTGAPARFRQIPETAYLDLVNQVTTGPNDTGSLQWVRWASDSTRSDGTHRVAARGTVPAEVDSILYAYSVPEPGRFGEVVFAEALQDAGVAALPAPYGATADERDGAYNPDRRVAEHVSPPLSEEIKVTLKVSQNVHAALVPHLLGAYAGPDTVTSVQAGFDLVSGFLEEAGLETSGAAMEDAAGADAHFTPAFLTRYLAYMASRSDAAVFRRALPILGRDGTLAEVQSDSPAAGHVRAKTGTSAAGDRLHRSYVLTSKALAGYVTTADGRELAFAFFLNGMPGTEDVGAGPEIAGEALGELATALYRLPVRTGDE